MDAFDRRRFLQAITALGGASLLGSGCVSYTSPTPTMVRPATR